MQNSSTRPALLWATLAGVVAAGCLPKDDAPPQEPAAEPTEDTAPPVAAAPVEWPFVDNFDRAELGPRYFKESGTWRVTDGWLHSTGEKNVPLWLNVPLPKNVKVEFTTLSKSKAVDTKVEIFGDGRAHESGYIVILGGWNNTITTIARLDEHEKTRVEKRTRWEPNREYRWRVQRTDGKTLELFIDDQKIIEYVDAEPLVGEQHSRLGFTNWLSDVRYDNLRITPLPN